MAKKCRCPPKAGEIPAWFMTYSDVITLLMTFFILLLTFSTDQPEKFEQMQVSVFGGGGATGVAGENPANIDRNSATLRYRPNIGRMTPHGSEMPPTDTDPVKESVNRGLQALEKPDELAGAERVSMQLAMNVLRNADGSPSAFALQQIRMLATQMKHLPLEARLEVGSMEDAAFCIRLAHLLQETQGVPTSRLSVSVSAADSLRKDSMRVVMTRTTIPRDRAR